MESPGLVVVGVGVCWPLVHGQRVLVGCQLMIDLLQNHSPFFTLRTMIHKYRCNRRYTTHTAKWHSYWIKFQIALNLSDTLALYKSFTYLLTYRTGLSVIDHSNHFIIV